jgi:hypothetical protein
MNFNKTLLLSALSLSLSALIPQAALATTINTFSDWGISTSDLSSSTASVQSTVEDQHGSYLNPGYGGQAYDAEAIYTTWDSDYLYIGIMTGRAQDAGGWTAGDISFDLGSDGSFEYGLVTSDATSSHPDGIGAPGDFYDVTDWNYGIWTAPGVHNETDITPYKVAHPTSIKAGTKTGNATSFSYSDGFTGYGAWNSDTHYFISAAIDLDLFGGSSALLDDGFSAHWTANCNNDWIQQDVAAVPEPSVLWLFSIGFIGLLSSGISRRKSRQS